jgi:predicted ATPase with chaperone activity
MLFKTLSASVYGIDAYLVEVEVDVGSARMQDFNVVGLPDNAVKESRERIKSALRNCSFEFPHGQGVTINLAPADVRKEGSAFDLPMALGLAGCMGHFFGKPLDKCMFLGELSLDGSVRSVRGALSATLAARECGLKSIAVPEANAREAAVVEGVDAVAAFGSGAVRGGFARRSRTAGRQAGAGSGVRGWTQHFVYRAAWGWQDHAGEADSYDSASDVVGGGD